jgi:hypothetical protein
MRVYKDFFVEEMLETLEKAHEYGHIPSEYVNSDIASLLYDFMETTMGDDITENEIYDYIRFDMEIQTTEELFENYDIECDEDEDKNEIVEEYITYHSAYIGNYKDNNITYHVFTQF